MITQVSRGQVGAAKVVLALEKVEGRESDDWVLRVANAAQPMAKKPGDPEPGDQPAR